jgi:hypothetical protein
MSFPSGSWKRQHQGFSPCPFTGEGTWGEGKSVLVLKLRKASVESRVFVRVKKKGGQVFLPYRHYICHIDIRLHQYRDNL